MASGKFSQPRNRTPKRRTIDDETKKLDSLYFENDQMPDAGDDYSPEAWQEPGDSEESVGAQSIQADEDQAILKAFDWEEKPSLLSRLKLLSGNNKGLVAGLCVVSVLLLGVIVALIVLTLSGGNTTQIPDEIFPNVYALGINLGGMTQEEAAVALEGVGYVYPQTDMVVSFPDDTLTLSAGRTGAKLDAAAAAEAAYAYGRSGTEEAQRAAYDIAGAQSYTLDVIPYLNLDKEYIRSVLDDYASQYADSYVPSGYELEGEKPPLEEGQYSADNACQILVLTKGKSGIGLNVDQLYQQILDAYSTCTFTVRVDDTALSQMEPEALDLDAIYGEVSSAAVDAVSQNGTITQTAVYGYDFDKTEAQELLDKAEDGNSVRISMRYTAPNVFSENAQFPDVLGSCDTPHTNNENRNTNLRLACAALDGVILQPGETLSYNETLGQRTAEKGYKKAPAYSGNDLVDDIGGGICQGSSTLYYAALLADLEIVQRVNHGFVSNYIDYGMDATVSWGGPDLKIKNNTDYPIKITAEVSDGYVRMKILGTDTRDYYVKMTYLANFTEQPTVYEEHGPDEGYTDGQVLKAGTRGVTVQTYKEKYKKGTDELISKEKEAFSSYKMVDRVVVKIVNNNTEPATTPTTEPATAPTETPTETTAPPTEASPTEPPATESAADTSSGGEES